MTKPLLHTRVRRTIDSDLSPEQVQNKLQNIASRLNGVSIIFEPLDSDTIAFEIDRNDLLLSGGFQRWQGTGCRLDILGEVLVPEMSKKVRYVLVTIFLLICSMIGFRWLVGEGIAIPFLCILMPIWMTILVVLWWVFEKFVPSDFNHRRRWHVQQELSELLLDIEASI